jgi:predicted ester cyclase
MKLLGAPLVHGAIALCSTLAFAQGVGAADMTAANSALLDRYIADVDAHDVAALKDVIAEGYVQEDPAQGRGLAGMQAAFQHYFQMFPDFRMTVEDRVVTDDKIVARIRITATHDRAVQLGPNAPVFPSTGKTLAWEEISIWRIADGKFVEHWGVDDLLGLVQQMRGPPASPPPN